MKLAFAALLVSSTALAAPSKSTARPAGVLAIASVSSPDAIGGLRAFSAAALPQSVALDSTLVLALENIAGAPSDALATDGPLYVVAIDDGTASGLVVIGRSGKPAIADGAAVIRKRNGWSAIGPKLAVDAVADYAFGTLVGKAPPAGLTATVYVPAVVARFKDDLAEQRSLLGNSRDGAADALGELLALAPDLDELHVTASGDAERAVVEVRAGVRAGSPLAGFVAAQHASDFALLGNLAEPSQLVVAGSIALGARAATWRQFLSPELAYLETPLASALDAIAHAATGDFALARELSGTSSTFVLGMADAKAADASFAALATAIGKGLSANVGGAARISFEPRAATAVDGVLVRDVVSTLAGRKDAEPYRYNLATVDRLAMVSFGTHPLDRIKAVVAIAHGKPGTLVAPAIAELVAGARKRGDSVVVAFDPATIAKHAAPTTTPISAALGFDRGVRIRIEVPASALRAIVNP